MRVFDHLRVSHSRRGCLIFMSSTLAPGGPPVPHLDDDLVDSSSRVPHPRGLVSMGSTSRGLIFAHSTLSWTRLHGFRISWTYLMGSTHRGLIFMGSAHRGLTFMGSTHRGLIFKTNPIHSASSKRPWVSIHM